jgi:hypothetical protein
LNKANKRYQDKRQVSSIKTIKKEDVFFDFIPLGEGGKKGGLMLINSRERQ